jgi:hypothetical protein
LLSALRGRVGISPASPSCNRAQRETPGAAAYGVSRYYRFHSPDKPCSPVLEIGFRGNRSYNYRRDVVALINAARLPAIYPERDYADDGGLMAYGGNVADNFRRAAGYVDRILKVAKPGDLPIQELVRFDFVINLKTAGELGLTIPPSILAQATEVIE